MANLERIYTIPLRKQAMKVPMYRRAKKAVRTVREFLSKHMKSDDVRLGSMLNLELWKRGMKNPPMIIKVTAVKDDKGAVKAELFGHKYVDKKKTEKVEKSKLEQLKEKMMGKEAEHNKEAIEHIHEHEGHDHTSHEKPAMHEKKQDAAIEKERKVTSGTKKGGIRDKN